MKKTILLIIVVIFLVSGCGNQKVIDNTEYDTYGLFNKGENKNENIRYRLIIENVVWSVLLCETIVAPIYFFGFSLYEPVRKTSKNDEKGEVL